MCVWVNDLWKESQRTLTTSVDDWTALDNHGSIINKSIQAVTGHVFIIISFILGELRSRFVASLENVSLIVDRNQQSSTDQF